MTAVQDRLRSYGPGAFVALSALIVLGFFYPQYFESLGDLPLIGDFIPGVGSMVIMIVFTMMAVGLNIVVGYAGLLDLGYVAFYAVGAYTAAWFASQQFDQWTFHFGSVGISTDVPGIHLSIWLVLIIAGALTALAGILIGLPTLRLRGDYLAIVTLGFGEIIPQVVRNGDNVFGFDLTHGTFGISPIDSPGFGSVGESLGLPLSYQQSFERAQWFYWTALGLLLFTVFCSVRLRDSRLGRAWIAIREDETAAAAMGVPLMRTKTWSYAIGAFFGGVAGAFYASFKSGAFPADFYFNISVFLLCMVILGGHGLDLGRDPRRHDPRVPERRGPGDARAPSSTTATGHRLRPDQVPVRLLRRDHRGDDALPAGRADPRAAAQARARARCARHAALRRHARGRADRSRRRE